jgi:hypothetical protein
VNLPSSHYCLFGGCPVNIGFNIGFNTEIQIGEQACHVQTEVHGPARPVIDTVVYVRGRVLHRRSQGYQDLASLSGFTEEALRPRVEEQHRAVIEELRAGSIPIEAGPESHGRRARSGISVQLLNPASWAAAGTATLEIEVLSRADRHPLPGAEIEVKLEGTQGPIRFAGRSDEKGRACLSFPMPSLGPGGAELIIRAAAKTGKDEIRYALRPKPKASTA